MASIKTIKLKDGITTSVYTKLKPEEKELKKGDRVQCADYDQNKDFEFIEWREFNGKRTAYCWYNGARTLREDSVKKSIRQLRKEKAELKRNRKNTKIKRGL